MKLVCVDTETTGLDPIAGEVIEVAAIVWEDGVRGPLWVRRFMPNGPVDAGAAAVNGFKPDTWGKLQGGAKPFSFDDARELYTLFQEGGTFLGAAIHFDIAFLKEAFRRVRHPWPNVSHRLIDIHSLALPLVLAGKIERGSLEAVSEFYGLGKVEHSAASDVDKTIKVFERLCLDALDGMHNADGTRAGLSDGGAQ